MLLVELALKENGIAHSITRFEAGSDAVQALCCSEGSLSSATPDAILLDLNTPRSDGFDVLVKLKHTPRFSRVPIAILTSSHARSDRRQASINGARYIEKPSDLKEFLSCVGCAVKEMLGGSKDAGG